MNTSTGLFRRLKNKVSAKIAPETPVEPTSAAQLQTKPKGFSEPKPVAVAVPQEPFFLSLVVPTYNVEPYIDQFLASVFGQSSPTTSFEVIIVDDGSTDGTADIVKTWERWFPDHVRYVFQENAGAAAARNTGIDLARGSWITFPDPDDFLNVHYFREMMKEVNAQHDKPLLAIVSNFVIYHEDKDTLSDTHPLRYRFSKGKVTKNTNELDNQLVSNMATVWMRRSAISELDLKVDEKVVPSFEDGHFTNRLFLRNPDQLVSFVPSARYYYRKRSAKTSILDTQIHHKGWFLDQLEFGYLNLLDEAQSVRGTVPRFIQRQIFYSLFWRFKHLLDREDRIAHLTPEERARFLDLAEEVMSHIGADIIRTMNVGDIREQDKAALLALYKGERLNRTTVYLEQVDTQTDQAQFSYFTGGDNDFRPRVLVNGEEVSVDLPSQIEIDFLGRTYYRRRFFWVTVKPGDELAFELDGTACPIRKGNNALGERVTRSALDGALRRAGPAAANNDTFRKRAYVRAMRKTYEGCQVLMDRTHKADDNAEHVYRHMMATGRADNAYFVLSKESVDWPRLEAEGFKLLDYGSDDHIAAQINSDVVLSSHYDEHVWWPVPERDFSDLGTFQFVFLQHGITINDMSDWFNKRNPRLLVTAMQPEYDAIAQSGGRFKFSEREVLLSGFPRHDALLRKAQDVEPDSILIMPTWRETLTDRTTLTEKMMPGKLDGFLETEFAQNWLGFLTSPRLEALAKDSGLRVVFCPHPNLVMYLEDMDIPDYIDVVDVFAGANYQDLFAQAKVAITDYSSASFDVAVIDRPVLYFQFDAHDTFGGEHIYGRGHFSYADDGYGPVVMSGEALLDALAPPVAGNEDPMYRDRRATAFPMRDGQCCERVCQAVEAILPGS